MKKLLTIIIALALLVPGVIFAQNTGNTIGFSNSLISLWKIVSGNIIANNANWTVTIPSLGGSGTVCLEATNTGLLQLADSGLPCGSGSGSGGGGSGTFSTTTTGNVLRQYPYTDLVTILDSTSTSTADWQFNPFTNIQYFSPNVKVGIGTTSPFAPLSVVGQAVAAYFTATTTTASTFPLANITKLSNLTSNGIVTTSGGDGTLSVDTTTYESGLTAGDGLTRTGNDFDFDGGDNPGGELGGTWASPTIDDSLAVTSWNLTTPTLTSFFGTPCTGNQFLQDIGDTGTFSCAEAAGGSSSAYEIATTSAIGVSQLSYFTKTSGLTTLGGVATTTVTASTPLSLSQAVVKVGGSNSVLSIADAVADGSTKGAATFTAADFNSSSGNISIDYTNGQAASGSTKGFLTSADWTTFNNKGSGTVTSVTGTWPVISSGGATPNITFGGLSTSSPIAAGANVLYATGVNTVASVATGTISVPTGLTVTANRYAIGGSAAIGLDTGYVIPLQSTLDAKAEDATTLTIAGTANQVTSSAGAQDLSTNRTWTLSFPNQVIFPQYASSTLGFSTAYASSTLYYGAGLANCASENMLTWTNGRFGCESDTSGGGGGGDTLWASTTNNVGIYPSAGATTGVVIGATATSAPEVNALLEVHGSTVNTGYLRVGANPNPLIAFLPNEIADFTANVDGFGNVGLANINPGTLASTNLVWGNDISTINPTFDGFDYYAACSIGSSNYSDPAFGLLAVPNSFSCYASDGPLQLASATSSPTQSYIQFITGGLSQEAMRIDYLGRVGVLNQDPAWAIDVNGDINIRQAQYYRQGDVPILYGTSSSVFVGGNAGSLFSIAAGSDFVTGVGYQAFYNASSSQSDFSTGVGYQALYNNNGLRNTAIGYQAMFKNYTGGSNVAIGAEALKNNLTGGTNIAIGNQALINLTSINDVIGIGNGALGSLTTGTGNTAVGYQAGGSLVSSLGSTFYGSQAGQYATGASNSIFGEGAGLGSAGSSSFGEATILGYRAGRVLTTGTRTTILGANAGNDITSGGFNICIGAYACDGLSTGATNLGLGYNVKFVSNTASGQMNIQSAIFGENYSGDSVTEDVNAETGIGENQPLARLHVKGGTAATPIMIIEGATSQSGDYLQINASSSAATGGDIFSIESNGRTGVGTTTPYAKLSVSNASLSTENAFAISTSTASATSTAFQVDSQGQVQIRNAIPYYGTGANTAIACYMSDGSLGHITITSLLASGSCVQN